MWLGITNGIGILESGLIAILRRCWMMLREEIRGEINETKEKLEKKR